MASAMERIAAARKAAQENDKKNADARPSSIQSKPGQVVALPVVQKPTFVPLPSPSGGSETEDLRSEVRQRSQLASGQSTAQVAQRAKARDEQAERVYQSARSAELKTANREKLESQNKREAAVQMGGTGAAAKELLSQADVLKKSAADRQARQDTADAARKDNQRSSALQKYRGGTAQEAAKGLNTKVEGFVDFDPDRRRAKQALSAIQSEDYGLQPGLSKMTDDEKNIFLSAVGRGDWSSAGKYLSLLERGLNQRAQAAQSAESEQYAYDHPVTGTVSRLGAGLFKGLGYAGNAGQAVKNAVTGDYEQTDPNSKWFSTVHGAQDLQSGLEQKAEDTGGPVARKAAALGLNVGDMALQMGVGGLAGKAASLGLMGASVAGDTTLDTLERGGTTGQALANATVAGAAEILTEKLPVDQLFSLAKGTGKAGARQVILNLLGTMGSEGAQEGITEIADNLADQAIMGDKSQYENYVRALMEGGMDEQSARNAATKQFYLKNVGQAAAGGALLGGLMGAGAQAIGYANGAQSRLEGRAIDSAYQSMQENGLFSDQATQARQQANQVLGLPVYPKRSAVTLPIFDKDGNQINTDSATQAQKTASTGEAGSNIGIIPFSEQEAQNLTSKKGVVDGHGMTFRQFVDGVKSLGNTVRFYFGKASDVLGQSVKNAIGQDISGYNIAIRSDEVAHAMAQHGNVAAEAKRGQLPVTVEALERLPEVFSAPDEVVALSSKDYAGRTAFEVRKQIDGYMVAVVGVADGRHSIEVDSVYIINKKGPPTTVGATQDASLDPTSKTSSGLTLSSTPIIADFSAKGNTQSAPKIAAVSPEDSTGAAPLGFDRYSHLQNEYGTIQPGESPTRVVDVPSQTKPHDKVSRTARTVLEAAATPDSAVGDVENAVENGKLSYIPTTNKQQTVMANAWIRNKGYEGALVDWTSEVRSGKASADTTARGAALYNAAVNAGDTKQALNILYDYASSVRHGAQAVQAARILKTLTPSGKLYMIQKEVNGLNESLPEKKTGKSRNVTAADNVPVELWMQRVGENLADSLAARLDVPEAKAKTVSETILSDLRRYADETAPQRQKPATVGRTEMDRITDLFQNKAAYNEAWEAAKSTLSDTFENSPEALSAFDEWLDSSLDYTKALSKELTGQDQIVIDESLADEYLKADTEKARAAAYEKILQNVADQIPSSWSDKWNAWRYLSMLGNPRTHVRNIMGNAGFVPVRMVKDAVATALESGVDVLTPGGIRKTKAALNPLSETDRALVTAAFQDLPNVEEQLLGSGKFSESAAGQIRDRQTIFKAKPLEAARKFNSTAMDVEDTWFSKPAYAGALAGYLKANGISAQALTDGTVDAQKLDDARAYAVREAQRATYRDANALSDFVAGLGYKGSNKVGKAANVLLEGVLPFKRTPANILARGLEYSPAGLAKGLTYDLAKVHGGDMTAAEAIDDISAGLTGTGLLALGAFLAAQGLVSGGGGDDQEQDNQDDLTGGQSYALSVGGKNYTLDWLAPEALPFFTGVELWNAMDSRADGSMQFKDLLSAGQRITDPMLEMSMLQGLQDAITAVKYNDAGQLPAVAANAAVSYLSQGLPTLLGQAERTGESDRETTFVDRKSGLPNDTQYLLGKTLNKIPGVEFQQMPYIDAWGRTESNGSAGARAFNNFLNPSYVSTETVTAADRELQRLKDAGQSGVFPQRASQSDKPGGEYLSQSQYEKYAKTIGQTSYDMVSDLISTPEYKAMNDEEKADAIELAYRYARAVGKEAVSNYEPDAWISLARAAKKELGLSAAEYLTLYQEHGGAANSDGVRDAYKAGISPDVYLAYRKSTEDLEADKDASGKSVSGSKKKKVISAIQDTGLSVSEKDWLYRSAGYAESGLYGTPWHKK